MHQITLPKMNTELDSFTSLIS